MKRAVAWSWLVAGACSGASTPGPGTGPERAPLTPLEVAQGFGERITREVDCTKSDVRFVCDLVDLPGGPYALPEKPHAWVGLLFAIRPSRTIEDGTRETLLLSRMTIADGSVWVERIDQSGTAASLELPKVRLDTVHAGNGERADVPVSLVLAGELDTRPDKPPVPVTKDGDGWSIHGERTAGLWHVPANGGRPPAWIVIEPVDRGDAGAFVHLFPDVPWVVPPAEAGAAEGPELVP